MAHDPSKESTDPATLKTLREEQIAAFSEHPRATHECANLGCPTFFGGVGGPYCGPCREKNLPAPLT